LATWLEDYLARLPKRAAKVVLGEFSIESRWLGKPTRPHEARTTWRKTVERRTGRETTDIGAALLDALASGWRSRSGGVTPLGHHSGALGEESGVLVMFTDGSAGETGHGVPRPGSPPPPPVPGALGAVGGPTSVAFGRGLHLALECANLTGRFTPCFVLPDEGGDPALGSIAEHQGGWSNQATGYDRARSRDPDVDGPAAVEQALAELQSPASIAPAALHATLAMCPAARIRELAPALVRTIANHASDEVAVVCNRHLCERLDVDWPLPLYHRPADRVRQAKAWCQFLDLSLETLGAGAR